MAGRIDVAKRHEEAKSEDVKRGVEARFTRDRF